MFGQGRRRRAAAAEAAREVERRALFAQLALRPETICPFLGLAYERIAYVPGPSIEHRCFAFGDPAPLSAEQQTRVCQQRGYGQCPRYLRGLLVTPTEELQALRNPAAAMRPMPPIRPEPRPAAAARPPRRRLVAALTVALVLLLAVAGAAYLALIGVDGVATGASATPRRSGAAAPTQEATATPAAPSAPATVAPTPAGPAAASEPPPSSGDTFAFYEVYVAAGRYVLYDLDDNGEVVDERGANFDQFSFARVDPVRGADGEVYWETAEGGLAGLAYRYPDSGDFRVRAVFLDDTGARRSVYLDETDLDELPEATPAP